MIKVVTKKQTLPKRLARIRAVIRGTEDRPRLSVYRSHTALIGQFHDDKKGRTICTSRVNGKNIKAGQQLGTALVKQAEKHGITKAVFDRGGNKYHGVIKTIADTVRQGGVTI